MRSLLVIVAATALAGALVESCSLNPQPLPPGAQSVDAGAGADSGQFNPGSDATVSDTGGGGGSDAATDALPGLGDTGSDAEEAGDGESVDGALDGSPDAEDGGEGGAD